MVTDLSHKTILVTAPDSYAEKLILLIKQFKGLPVHFPAIQTYIKPDLAALMAHLKNIKAYPYVVLPSRTAIDAFFKAARVLAVPIDWSDTAFFAFGNDQNYLQEQYHIAVKYRPSEPGPQGIVSYFETQKIPENNKVLVIKPEVVGVPEPNVIPNFLQALKKVKMDPVSCVGYITQARELEDFPVIMKGIERHQIDQIAFTSTAEIMVVLKTISAEQLNQFQIACFGPYTGANAVKLGLKPAYIGTKYADFKDFVIGMATL